MQGFLQILVSWALRLLLKPVLSSWVPIPIQRGWLSLMSSTSLPPRGTQSAQFNMGNVPAEKINTAKVGQAVLLYLHGGGYCIGSIRTHRPLAAHIARAAQATCYIPDYRLAPEHPHPAALDDALAAYRWLLAQNIPAKHIIIAGDSAGGGLALATGIAIRDSNLSIPAGLVLISPWADLSLSGDTIQTHASRDPILSRSLLSHWSQLYRGEHPVKHPPCSPLFANMDGLPPMLIQVGSEEILLSDSQRLAQRAQSAGISVQLGIYERMWHDFHIQAGLLEASDRAITEIGDFVKNTIAVS